MTVLSIRKAGDPILKEVAKPVEKIDRSIKKLVKDMFETMAEADGVGLAAPQVGESIRLVVINMGDGPFELINPVITERDGEQCGPEGCLSVPGLYGDVTRANKVTVEATNLKGKPVKYTGEGLRARAFQHELDHLEGVLFIERASALYIQKRSLKTNENSLYGYS